MPQRKIEKLYQETGISGQAKPKYIQFKFSFLGLGISKQRFAILFQLHYSCLSSDLSYMIQIFIIK